MKRITFLIVFVVSFFSLNAQWVKTGQLSKDSIIEISAVNKNTCIALLSDNSAHKTTDCGKTWERIAFLPHIKLKCIAFYNEKTGIIAGENGNIAITNDGGGTWESKKIDGYNGSINDIIFVNEKLAFMGGTIAFTILRSTDGGKNWELVENNALEQISGIFFTSEERGFAVGHSTHNASTCITVAKTLDGGKTWKKYPIENFNAELKAQNNIFVSPDNKGVIVCNDGRLIRTVDEFRTFSISNPLKENNSEFNAILIGNACQGIGSAKDGKLYASEDFGQQWTILDSTSQYMFQHISNAKQAIYAADSAQNFFVLKNELPRFKSEPVLYCEPGQKYIYNIKTTDKECEKIFLSKTINPSWLKLISLADGTGVLAGIAPHDFRAATFSIFVKDSSHDDLKERNIQMITIGCKSKDTKGKFKNILYSDPEK